MPNTDTMIAESINRIQIPVISLDCMVDEYLEATDFQVRAQFASEPMRAHARKAAADVTIATTLAQIMRRRSEFEAALDVLAFSDVPNELIAGFKGFMLDKSHAVPGFAIDLTPLEVSARFDTMKRLLEH